MSGEKSKNYLKKKERSKKRGEGIIHIILLQVL